MSIQHSAQLALRSFRFVGLALVANALVSLADAQALAKPELDDITCYEDVPAQQGGPRPCAGLPIGWGIGQAYTSGRAVCKIVVYGVDPRDNPMVEKEFGVGTGWLVDYFGRGDLVITARHCVDLEYTFAADTGPGEKPMHGDATNMEPLRNRLLPPRQVTRVYCLFDYEYSPSCRCDGAVPPNACNPGDSCDTPEVGPWKDPLVWVSTSWRWPDDGCDWALLKVRKSANGTVPGQFFPQLALGVETLDEPIVMAQHPAGRPKEIAEGFAGQFHDACNFRHDIDSEQGSSGSPVLYLDGNAPRVMGVHVAEIINGANTGTKLAVGASLIQPRLPELVNTLDGVGVVISQVFGAGGEIGAMWSNDYVEIYNSGPVAQDLNGWAVQYAAATGAVWAVTPLPNVTLDVGQYLLVQEGAGSSADQCIALPTPDAVGNTAMSTSSGKVALTSSQVALNGAQPINVVDLVGYGPAANWRLPFAGTADDNAREPSAHNAVFRLNCGETHLYDNARETTLGTPSPRNLATPKNQDFGALGMAHPFVVAPQQTVRLCAIPFTCSFNTQPLLGAAITVDASAIGGNANLALRDKGQNGDEVANDGVFSATVAVAANTAANSYRLPYTFNDALQSGGAYIGVLVRAAAAPDNDQCSTAQVINGPYAPSVVVNGSLNGATLEYNPMISFATAPTSGFGARRGVWYRVTGTGKTLTASLCGTNPAFDSVLAVFGGSCDGLTVVANNDDNGPACAGSQASASWCSKLGAPYWIWVSTFSTGAQNKAFALEISEGAACNNALKVDVCYPSPPAGRWLPEKEEGYGLAIDDGCDALPEQFQDVPICPKPVVWGTARAYADRRDSDWYRFLAPFNGAFTATVHFQGQCVLEIYELNPQGGCAASQLLAAAPNVLERCTSSNLATQVLADHWYAVRIVPTGVTINTFGGIAVGASSFIYTLELGIAAADSDGDGDDDCEDGCPNDPSKSEPGICGCGVAEFDSDGDSVPDCNDACPSDPSKAAPGQCGCGFPDYDGDGDGIADCIDNCAAFANPTQSDCDGDGAGDTCEIQSGTQHDGDLDGIPDECEASGPANYCTAGTSSNGCNAFMSAVGTPSVSASSGFVLIANNVEGQKTGLFFYGVNGPHSASWGGGSSSFLCVKAPSQRLPSQSSGGNNGACDGQFSADFLTYLASHPTALGQPFQAGQNVWAQAWYRDPPAPKTTSLTDGMTWAMTP